MTVRFYPWRLLGAPVFFFLLVPQAQAMEVPPAASTVPAVVTPQSGKKITLAEALELAAHHPAQKAAGFDKKARQGALRQAALLPNPIFFAEFEEFGGSGDYAGNGAMSSRFGLNQEVLLGGKRGSRMALAGSELHGAELQEKLQAVTLSGTVADFFLKVALLQEGNQLAEENLAIARQSAAAISRRVQAGELAPMEETRMTVELARAETVSLQTGKQLESARFALASALGGDPALFETVHADLDPPAPPPGVTELLPLLEESPRYLLLANGEKSAAAALRLARSESWPDLEVGGGLQQFEETGDHAYFFEISVPLPLFDRNQGTRQEATAGIARAEAERRAGLLELQAEMVELVRQLQSASEQIRSMDTVVLPAAGVNYQTTHRAFLLGEAGSLELLEAQRTLLETKRERLELLGELFSARIALDTLLGRPLLEEAK